MQQRRNKWIFAIFAMLPALGAAPIGAVERDFGGAKIDVPASWVQQGTKQMFVRSFDDYKSMLQVSGPFAEPIASFDRNFDTLARTIKEMANEDVMTNSRGTTVAGHQIRIESRCCGYINDIKATQTLVGVASSNRQVFLLLLELGRGEDEEEDAVSADMRTITRTMIFQPGDKPFALTPRAGDGGLDGVYTTLKTGIRLNPFGGTDFYADSEVIQFDPSGLYSGAIPTDGKSMAQFCAVEPHECGFYALKGGGFFRSPSQIEMTGFDEYGVGEVDLSDFKQENESLTIDGAAYTRIPPFPSGKTFDGTWHYTFAQSGSLAFSSASVAVERMLRLKPDGTFDRSGWAGGSFSDNNGGVTTSTETPGATGTYEVEGYTLNLNPNGGEREVLSIYAPDMGSDGLLIINGGNYLKKE